ncbi:MAG: sn-glycerol-3-phosphate ABC transporter ATP-binding protein UgpC [Deltaproteobacteria bacterium]|nr:sn-glycerol-3-phosphate ABC transporter ATP-binding protein UgpC [Deltaproteobacteria bacterium]
MADLVLTDVEKHYGDVAALRGVSLDVESGDFVAFVGPSGCGKSTLLRSIAGLESITSGEIRIGGERADLKAPGDRGVAMVFQAFALYPHMTARENLAFGLRNIGLPKDEIARRIGEAARILKIEPLLERRPGAMSGGQRQRIAIGRAIVKEPKLFLFDEPLSSLDAALRVEMRSEIVRLHQRLGSTMVYVTHDQVEAMTMATHIVVLNAGRVEQVGTPLELYRSPCNVFVARFLGSPPMNVLPAEVEKNGGARAELRAADATIAVDRAIPVGTRLFVGVRPEDLHLADDGPFRGEVQVVERLGHRSLVHLSRGDQTLVAECPGDVPVHVGEQIAVAPRERSFHLFDEAGLAIGGG